MVRIVPYKSFLSDSPPTGILYFTYPQFPLRFMPYLLTTWMLNSAAFLVGVLGAVGGIADVVSTRFWTDGHTISTHKTHAS